jgi:hypothetical protein
MDYCSSCRRHLNGALVCPGCGSYAPDIAPVTAVSRTVPASGTWDDGRFLDMTDEDPQPEPAAGTAETADLVDAPPAPQGRAARRRQRARWKKSQRRAVVATAFALVGGAVTVASMDRQGGDRTQAATAPEVAGGTGAEVDEEGQGTLPASTRPDSTRHSGSTPATQPTAPERASRQDTAPLTTTPRNTRPDAATVSRTTPISDTQPQAAAPDTGGTPPDATETTPTPTPTPPAADDSGTTDGGTESGTTPESPDPAATSPSQVCVLVLCIG